MNLTSTTFVNNGKIPARYTCEGDNVHPPLVFTSVPAETHSLALTMEDWDVPKQLAPQGYFDHWVLFNIPVGTVKIDEGQLVGTLGSNSAGKAAYAGPCPPVEYEPSEHSYTFRLYALNRYLDLKPGATKADVETAMEGHIIAQAKLVGRYKKEMA